MNLEIFTLLIDYGTYSS